jgi:hypothetical protein
MDFLKKKKFGVFFWLMWEMYVYRAVYGAGEGGVCRGGFGGVG